MLLVLCTWWDSCLIPKALQTLKPGGVCPLVGTRRAVAVEMTARCLRICWSTSFSFLKGAFAVCPESNWLQAEKLRPDQALGDLKNKNVASQLATEQAVSACCLHKTAKHNLLDLLPWSGEHKAELVGPRARVNIAEHASEMRLGSCGCLL